MEPPPRSIMAGPSPIESMRNDRKLTARMRSRSASVKVSGAPPMAMPALLTSTSTPPVRDSTASARRRPAPDGPRSAGMTSGSFRSSAATRSKSATARPVKTTRAPDASSSRATASPMPRLEPVTSAVFDARTLMPCLPPISVWISRPFGHCGTSRKLASASRVLQIATMLQIATTFRFRVHGGRGGNIWRRTDRLARGAWRHDCQRKRTPVCRVPLIDRRV